MPRRRLRRRLPSPERPFRAAERYRLQGLVLPGAVDDPDAWSAFLRWRSCRRAPTRSRRRSGGVPALRRAAGAAFGPNALREHGSGRSFEGRRRGSSWSGSIRAGRQNRTGPWETAKPPAASVAAHALRPLPGGVQRLACEALGQVPAAAFYRRSPRRGGSRRSRSTPRTRRAGCAATAQFVGRRGDLRQRGAGRRNGRGRGSAPGSRFSGATSDVRPPVQETETPFSGGPAGPPETGTDVAGCYLADVAQTLPYGPSARPESGTSRGMARFALWPPTTPYRGFRAPGPHR